MLHPSLLLFSLVSLMSLSACGGGSSDTEPATLPAVSTNTASASSASTHAQIDTNCGLPNFQADLLKRINALRAAGATCGQRGKFPAAAELKWQVKLANAAAVHSIDMVTKHYFSHTGSDQLTAGERISAAGYAWTVWAENIATGQTSVDQVMNDWIASDGHCANLMQANVTEVGVACVRDDSKQPYWTMNLARPG